jgi:hypothetical protein
VKGLYTDYDRELILPGIRRFVYEYLQNLDIILNRVKRARASIREKSQFYINRIVIIRFVYRSLRRSPTSDWIRKILR